MSDRERKLLAIAGLVVVILILRAGVWPWWAEHVDNQEREARKLAKQIELFEKLVERHQARVLEPSAAEGEAIAAEEVTPAATEWDSFIGGFYSYKAPELASADLQRQVQQAAVAQGLTLTLIDVPEMLEFENFRMLSVRFSFRASLHQVLSLINGLYEDERRLLVPSMELNFKDGSKVANVDLTVSGFQFLDAQ